MQIDLETGLRIALLGLLIVCAVGACLCKKLLTTVVVYMSYSTIMAIVWMLAQAPDLAITEAAVGAGVSTILYFVCLRKLGGTRKEDNDKPTEKEHPNEK